MNFKLNCIVQSANVNNHQHSSLNSDEITALTIWLLSAYYLLNIYKLSANSKSYVMHNLIQMSGTQW